MLITSTKSGSYPPRPLPENSSEQAISSPSPISPTAMRSCARCARYRSGSMTSAVWQPPPLLPCYRYYSRVFRRKSSPCASSRFCFNDVLVTLPATELVEKPHRDHLQGQRVACRSIENSKQNKSIHKLRPIQFDGLIQMTVFSA